MVQTVTETIGKGDKWKRILEANTETNRVYGYKCVVMHIVTCFPVLTQLECARLTKIHKCCYYTQHQ